jgi:hypothetical protein
MTDNSYLNSNISTQSSYVYKSISISNDGKYLCAATDKSIFTCYSNETIINSSTYTFSETTTFENAKYISASNKSNTTLCLISSNDQINAVTQFTPTVFNYIPIDLTGNYLLLSDINYDSSTSSNIVYSVKSFNVYKINLTTYTSTKVSELSNVSETWSSLKSIDSNNSLFSSTSSIYTRQNNTYVKDDISATNFVDCSMSNLNGNIPYMLAAVNNTNTIIYSLNGGGTCFIENTKITILENNEEIQKYVQYLKKDDLVKTSDGTYKKIVFIGYNKINVLKNLNHIMILDENTYNSNEKLYLTSGHSILFKDTTFINEYYNPDIYTDNIDGYYKIMTQHCSLFRYANLDDITHINNNNFVNYYHIALENDDHDGQYGIYANNVLCESMSINYISECCLIEINNNFIEINNNFIEINDNFIENDIYNKIIV